MHYYFAHGHVLPNATTKRIVMAAYLNFLPRSTNWIS